MFYVYLLEDNKNEYYIGQTENLQERLKEHNSGRVKSTRHRIPLQLIGCEIYKTRNEARWREYNLKKSAWQRNKFVKKVKEKKEFSPRAYGSSSGAPLPEERS